MKERMNEYKMSRGKGGEGWEPPKDIQGQVGEESSDVFPVYPRLVTFTSEALIRRSSTSEDYCMSLSWRTPFFFFV
jgi:hypothetical protein